MGIILATIRCGSAYARMYQKGTKIFVSIFGQLAMFTDNAEFEVNNVCEAMFTLKYEHFPTHTPVEIQNKTTGEWYTL